MTPKFALPLRWKSPAPGLLASSVAFCGLPVPTFPPVVWQGLHAMWFLQHPVLQNSTLLSGTDTLLFSKLSVRVWHSEPVPSSPLSLMILSWDLSGLCWSLLAWIQGSPQLVADHKKNGWINYKRGKVHFWSLDFRASLCKTAKHSECKLSVHFKVQSLPHQVSVQCLFSLWSPAY